MGLAQSYAGPLLHVAPKTMTVAHWGRLDEGELFAKARYVDWAVLMKRSFRFDVLRCPRCGTRMRLLATIPHPATIRRILAHLGARAELLAREAIPARSTNAVQLYLMFQHEYEIEVIR